MARAKAPSSGSFGLVQQLQRATQAQQPRDPAGAGNRRPPEFGGHDPLDRPGLVQAVLPGRLPEVMRQADQFQRHVAAGAAGEFFRRHQVGHGADRFAGAERIVGGDARQRQHRQELRGGVLQAEADMGGNPAVVEREHVVSAAGEVPAQAGDGVDLLARRIAALDFGRAAERPAEIDEIGGRIIAGIEGLLAAATRGCGGCGRGVRSARW